MKKVLIVFNHPAPYKVRLFNELSKYFDLHVIFERSINSDRNKLFYFENEYKFTVHKIKGVPFGKENIFSFGVKNHIKNNKYDLIIMNGYSQISEMIAIDYMKKENIPYVLYINGGQIKDKESKIKIRVKKHYISGAKAYFSPDSESDKYLTHYGANANIYNYPYSTIYESEILKNKVDKESIKKELSITNKNVYVSAGQLIKRKNYLTLLNSWTHMPTEYGLYILGDGKQYKKLNRFILKNNLENVKLLGYVKRGDCFKYFRCADAFLFPSKEDIYGHVINESMSQGLPVISSNKVNSAKKLISKNNGVLLDDFSSKNLENAIKNLEKTDCFNDCILTAKNNTIEKMCEKHIEIIGEVMKL